MDRYHELEDLRRSLAMLPPGTKALDREAAMRLLAELQEVEGRLGNLRDALRGVLDEGRDR
jgi:hypothetical protein